MMRRFSLAIIGSILVGTVWAGSNPAVTETVHTLASRPGVTESFYLDAPPTPAHAAVILFAGGNGKIDVTSQPPTQLDPDGPGNFLVRSRRLFAQQGLLVATVDVPSDHQFGVDGTFRTHDQAVQDVAALIAWLQQQADVPVWLVGTSRGTETATHAAIRLGDKVAGLVLTSSITVPSRNDGYTVTSMALDRIHVPTLIVSQADDACELSPPDGAASIAAALGSAVKRVAILHGGGPPRGPVCLAHGHHGFVGQEAEAVQAIAAFIGHPAIDSGAAELAGHQGR